MDVDGSYLYKKYKLLSDAGTNAAPLPPPEPPQAGWATLTPENIPDIPLVTQGEYNKGYCVLKLFNSPYIITQDCCTHIWLAMLGIVVAPRVHFEL